MRLHIRHATRYTFDAPVSYGLQQLRKTPKSNISQKIVEWRTEVVGGTKELSFEDHHHNVVELLNFDRDATELTVLSEGIVDLGDTHGIVGRHRGPSPLWLYELPTDRTAVRAGVRGLVRGLKEEDPLPRLHELSQVVRDAVRYEVGASHPDWSAEEALAEGAGVCQDHTHIFLAAARHLGFPARYVSGYLMLDDTTAQDAMHAWAEAHVEGLGWVGFDISNGISPDTRYVRVATGCDYADAAPVSGMRQGGAGEQLSVDIQVSQQ